MRHTVRGFTLLELIVVIAIIGVLSVIILPSFSTALARSRDAQRKLDISNIQKMLDQYTLYATSLPSSLSGAGPSLPYPSTYLRSNSSPGFWDTQFDLSSNTSGSFLSFLVTSGVATRVPIDPSNTPKPSNGFPYDPGYRYWYRSDIAYWNGSTYVYLPGYMLGIARFENSSENVQQFVGCPSQINSNGAYNSMIYVVCGYVR